MSLIQLGLNITTTVSHMSTPFMTTFLLVHLTAPVVATLGGSGLSSQAMLFGREYYQGPLAEPWLVFAPLALHVSAGILKRIISTFSVQHRGLRRRSRSPMSLLTTTAYPLIIFLSIHVLTHRLIPSTPNPPIQALSPSELDYDFVKVGIRNWPLKSAVLYGGLLMTAIPHSLEGVNVIIRTWFPTTRRLSETVKRIITDILVSCLVLGLVRISREAPPILLKSTTERILASYRSLWVYRF